jgi:hypothetical protein
LLTLGMADEATPALKPELWRKAPGKRVRPTRQEQGAAADADYF